MTDNEILTALKDKLYGERWDKGDIPEIKEAVKALVEAHQKLIETTCVDHEHRISTTEGKMIIVLALISANSLIGIGGLLKAFEVW